MDISSYRSEVQELIRKIQKAREKLSDETIQLCDSLEKYGRNTREDALIGYSCFTRGEIYYYKNDMVDFYREMLSCIAPFERIEEWGYLAMANNMLGIMSLNRGNAPFALDYYLKAMSYCRDYKLPDLEWMIHMNMGSLYLNTGHYDDAARHFDAGYNYIRLHQDNPGSKVSLTAAYVGLGRSYMAQDDINRASEYREKLQKECMPFISDEDKLTVYCFFTSYFYRTGEKDKLRDSAEHVGRSFSKDTAIMDDFDDIYDFFNVLLDEKEYDVFLKMISPVMEITRKTKVRKLEQKLTLQMIRYYKDQNQMDKYAMAAIHFVDLNNLMEQENNLMISSMIDMRQEIYNLAEASKQMAKENKNLQRMSETDPLTGMYNRLRLNNYSEITYNRAFKNQTGLAVEILDIDFFKEYNDNYGHQAGDKVIQFIARAIGQLQQNGRIFAARYGGDEFVLIYEGYRDTEVFDLAKQLKHIIMSSKVRHDYSRTDTKFITVSQGIYWNIPKAQGSVWDYLHEADNLLYKVKVKSRNSIMLGHETEPSGNSAAPYYDRSEMVTLQNMDDHE